MRTIKTFGSFINESENNIEKYVDDLLENKFEKLFDILGLDLPAELEGEEYEEAKQKVIEYFEQNPEQIGKV